MGNHKLTMELIADKKSRYRTFKTREMGLKKKISELCTLCDVKACLIVYGSDGDGPSSSQPRFWPENRDEVECIIKQYMEKIKEEPGKRSLNLSDVLDFGKKRAELKSPMLQKNFCRKKRSNSFGGLDKLSYEELMEIIGKLDKDLEEVDNLISLKKGETNSISELPVHCCPMPISYAIQPFDSRVPLEGTPSVDSDQGTGTVEDDLNSMINSLLTMEADDFDFMLKSMGETDDLDFMMFDLMDDPSDGSGLF